MRNWDEKNSMQLRLRSRRIEEKRKVLRWSYDKSHDIFKSSPFEPSFRHLARMPPKFTESFLHSSASGRSSMVRWINTQNPIQPAQKSQIISSSNKSWTYEWRSFILLVTQNWSSRKEEKRKDPAYLRLTAAKAVFPAPDLWRKRRKFFIQTQTLMQHQRTIIPSFIHTQPLGTSYLPAERGRLIRIIHIWIWFTSHAYIPSTQDTKSPNNHEGKKKEKKRKKKDNLPLPLQCNSPTTDRSVDAHSFRNVYYRYAHLLHSAIIRDLLSAWPRAWATLKKAQYRHTEGRGKVEQLNFFMFG